MSPKLADLQLYVGQSDIMHFISRRSVTLQSCLCWMNQLAKTDQALRVSFTAAVLLHAAYKTTQNSLTDEMLDVLATTCMQSNDVRLCLNARHSSVLSLHQAAILMKIVANISWSTVQLIEIELSKAYLYRALKCKDSSSIYCLANVYLAVLYCTTGQYQTAIDFCTLMTRSHEHSQCSSYVVQGELLPRIDHQVDSSLGLAVFYQYIRTAAFSEEQSRRQVNFFTTEQFAHYLLVKLLSVAINCHQLPQTSLAAEHRRYRQRFCASSKLFITDVIVFSFTKRIRCLSKNRLTMADENKSSTLRQLDTSKLVELLQQSAVEHLSRCRELDFLGFGQLTLARDFRALNAYKYGQYKRCLQISMRNVSALAVNRDETYLCLPLIPECIQLLDDDIVSLIGLVAVVGLNPSCIRLSTRW